MSSLNILDVLMNSTSINVVIYKAIEDNSDFEFVAFNKGAEITEGISSKALIGKRLTEAFPGVEEFGLLKVLQRVHESGVKEIYDDGLYSDDRVSTWRFNEVQKLEDGNLLVIYHDKTEKITNQESQKLLRSFIEHSADEIYMFEQDSLLFTYANPVALKNIRYSLKELQKMTPLDIKPYFDEEKFRDQIKPLLKNQLNRIVFNTAHQRKDSSIYEIEVALQSIIYNGVKQIVVIALDLTERKLKESLAKLQRAEEIANLGLWEWNIETGQTYWSDQIYSIFGESPQNFEVTRETFFHYIPKEDRRILMDALENAIQTGQVYNVEHKIRLRDGRIKYVKGCGEVIYDSLGVAKKVMGSVLDVTEKETLLEELRDLTHNLQEKVEMEVKKNNQQTMHIFQQSRLAQMGEMISMIAHQWRQPLSSLSAISSTLTLDILTENYNREFFTQRLEDISNLAQHLSSTIDDFRGFFKEDKEKNSTSFEQMCSECLSILGPVLQNENIKITKEFSDKSLLFTYHNEVKQVILNIIKNAQDAIKGNNIKNGEIHIKIIKEDDYSIIHVEDNAGGIAEDILKEIFNPYFSTKKEKDGTGLGLYMSKVIIEEHCEGEIRAQNINSGARFSIKLPIH
ncbi:PAS domain S-box protein [Sulfurimonas aquatica]|uniref:histidine kinase n=1 Tax=Sulfurimonas aquatica TaxID=2672570 RepID=A0A975B0K2_9BACT|nr:PAS domain S-box protein [Sulfurimonas aquatica]QSZ42026.1 PAS domain S-box protein [Sulfurimonas aquatica]